MEYDMIYNLLKFPLCNKHVNFNHNALIASPGVY